MPHNWNPSTRFARAWRSAFVCLCLAGTALLPAAAQADARSQAKRIHDRLAGVPPTEAVLDAMASDIAGGRATDAANTAMEHRAFYDVTLKNFAAPWTNRDQTVFVPLNDYMATVIGMVRDDVAFDRVLSDDILYVGRSGLGVPGYSPSSNDHYEALESQGVEPQGDLVAHDAVGGQRHAGRRDRGRADHARGRRGVLRRRHQPRDVPLHVDEPPVHGHGAGAGHDPAAGPHPPGREPQPGRRQPHVPEQLHRLPLRAWTRWRRRSRTTTTTRPPDACSTRPASVQPKYFNNKDTFPAGYITPDDTGTTTGARARTRCSAGTARCRHGHRRQVARPRARAAAMPSLAARCRRCSGTSASARRATRRTAPRWRRCRQSSRSNGYQLKQVFAEAAAYCMGD